jgi:drug/metabolite transporter (DMT)-like permease
LSNSDAHLHSARSGLVFALGAAACYGLNIAFARMAALAGITGTNIVFYRVFVLLAVLLPIVWIARRSLRPAPGEGAALTWLAVTSTIVGLAYLSSVTFVPVTIAVVILYLFPVLIVLMAPLVDRTPFDPLRFVLAGIAFAGVAMVVGPAFDALDWRGLALAGLAAIGAAVQFFAAARCRRSSTTSKLVLIHVMVLPVTGLVGLMTGTLDGPAILMAAPLAAALTIAGYLIGFGLQLVALARTSAAAAGLAFCAEPLFAAGSSMLFLGERLDAIQVAGAALVIGVIVLNVWSESRRQAPATVPAPAPAQGA